MNALLTILAACLTGFSGLLGLLVGTRQRPQLSAAISVTAMLTGAICGITAALRAALGFGAVAWAGAWGVPGGALDIRIDPIAGIFLTQVFLIGALGAIYGIGYWPYQKHPDSTVQLRVFYGLMVGGMALLIAANNSILFLVGWEIMALAAFLALTADDRSAATREAGLVYLVTTRVGTLALIAMFALLRTATSSYSFSTARLAADSPAGTAILCLGLLGFGIKAGVMPLHLWLPGAHANAPTHVSALMSGVLIKMGIYGLIRLGSVFRDLPLWWGLTLFVLGAVSAVLGVAFALGQHDLKRLLAYHSVENIGIIVMSLGVAAIGRSISQPGLVTLGLAGALLHTFNHGLFKSLLFFGAGSVIAAAKTHDINRMGGLAKILPFTALAFLVGAAAICGLPPLNGFISEWFLYVGMLKGGVMGNAPIGTLLLFGVPILALVGALAVACFVKVHGVVFLGEPRGHYQPQSHESPTSMLLPMALLSVGCVLIGTAPLVVAGTLQRAVLAWQPVPSSVNLAALVPFKPLIGANCGLLVVGLGAALLLKQMTRRTQTARAGTWDCGYAAPSPRMQYTASSFSEWLVSLFSMILRPRAKLPTITASLPSNSQFESHVPEVVLELAVFPVVRWLASTASRFRRVQPGNIHLYIVYILTALVVMLVVWH